MNGRKRETESVKRKEDKKIRVPGQKVRAAVCVAGPKWMFVSGCKNGTAQRSEIVFWFT